MEPTPPTCPVCRAADPEVLYDLRGIQGPQTVPGLVVRCRKCGMWYKPVDDPARLSEVYGEAYAEGDVVEHYMAGPGARAFFRKVVKGIQPPPVEGRKPRLLDIGTGLGVLLEEAEAAGYDAEGLDLCEPLVEKAKARGLKVRCMRAEDLASDASYEVVTLLDVVEHLSDPLSVLAVARRLVVPGGEIVIYTPNHRAAVVGLARAMHRLGMSSPLHDIFGRNHICFFDDRTLPLMLKQAGCRLRRVRLFPYDPGRPGGSTPGPVLAGITAVEWLGRPFGRTLRMLAYARPE